MATLPALTFQHVTFTPIEQDGQIWLRGHQIGVALGYKSPHKLQQVYERNASEFSCDMTALAKLPDLLPQSEAPGQMREVRIFSLRGAHLLGMLARAPRAAEFRHWVLDVLDKHAGTAATPASALERADYRAESAALAMSMVADLRAGRQPTLDASQAQQIGDGMLYAWLLRDARWVLSFNRQGQMQMQRIEPGMQLLDTQDRDAMCQALRHAVPPAHLAHLVHCAVEALASRSQL